MPQQDDAATEDHIRCAVTALTTVFESFGAEHQALVGEAGKTSARERCRTVNRMSEEIVQAAHMVSSSVVELATVRGLRVLGVRRQFAKDSEGNEYSPLMSMGGDSSTMLCEVVAHLSEAAATLGRVYQPTKKYPSLAVARCPGHMKVAFSGLRAALDAVCADLTSDDPEVAQEYTSAQALLTRLEDRACRTVPAQGAGLTADEVAAAIRADPEVARAAAAALAIS
ncbi:hypothetical protein [Streptomyces sp. NPDC007088]|uniref:hypothetical protein n=1 Tax=Streptomyces sp. NPDC007088 TaxID=3364773 RepID=UPI003688C836